ncbi:MAG: hypothetical protein ACR2NZ_00995 [Rubripirellula sp.]
MSISFDIHPFSVRGAYRMFLSTTHSLVIGAMPDMQKAQFMMVGGFIMLGWVLARRQIRMRKTVNKDARAANKSIQAIRDHKDPAIPLCDAPAETQRWQAAMFDLQRELKAELDTRIVVVQTLLRQVDDRIQKLSRMESLADGSPITAETTLRQQIRELFNHGHSAEEIATATGMPIGDVELTLSTLRPSS